MRKANTPVVPLLALLALSVTACGGGGGGTGDSAAPEPVVAVSLLPADGARDVKPDGAFTPKDALAVDTE
ncbi:hypothetical protein ACODT3_13455 [Streptomyces sp. 4.24]|uniref:hypothetical protein n=1 Tax=Streptomyces tritrimontium TaxID=3406573 RepID=UPI003BB53D9B